MQKSRGFSDEPLSLEHKSPLSLRPEGLEKAQKLLTCLRRTVSSVSPEDLLQLSDGLESFHLLLNALEEVRQKSIFERLPKPLLERVLVHLMATDLARCSGVNMEWHVLATRIAKRRYLALWKKRKDDKSFYPNWFIDPDPDSVTWITQLRAKEIEYSVVQPSRPTLQVPAAISLFPIPLEVTGCGLSTVNGLYYNTSISQTGLIFTKRLANRRTCFIHKLYSGQRSFWYLSLRSEEGVCVQICHAREGRAEDLLILPMSGWVCFAENHNPPPTIELRRDLCLRRANQTFLGDLDQMRLE